MEIHLKLNNKYGYGTTYAHEKQKYETLVPKPSKQHVRPNQSFKRDALSRAR
jgi:hypothetical protein